MHLPRTNTELHGNEEKQRNKEEAFATDEHGITRKSRIKAFSPRRRKERKVKQEILTCLLLLSGLSVFAVKILGELPSKEKALATDEHGKRIEKTGINYSHREDAKSAK